MDAIRLHPISGPVDRTICLPGSKSLTNRALLTAALADRTSELTGVLFAEDTECMMDCLGRLGVSLDADRERRRVRVRGVSTPWPQSDAELDCRNAGTVIRFLTAACAGSRGRYRLDGVERMRSRPIGNLVCALRDLGASIEFDAEPGFCPLTVNAAGLGGGTVRLDAAASSQFVSALLMAAPLAGRDVMIELAAAIPSRPYIAMTMSVMDRFGVSVVQDEFKRFIVPAPQSYRATPYDIEPDASAASYFFAAAALTGGRVTVDGLGSGSVQGDLGFVEVLCRMGCRVERTDKTTTVYGPADGRLHGVDVDLNDMPDVVQTLAVLAAFAEGATRIRNVPNLRLKETDRLSALATELARMGVDAVVEPDGLTVCPAGAPKPSEIETYHDHRMAMSFSLAGLRLDGMVIRDPDCVSKTFPEFFDLWSDLT